MHIDFSFGPDWDFERKVLHIGRLLLANQSEIKEKLDLMSQAQDEINAAVVAIKGVTDGLTTAFANIQSEIADLKAAAGSGEPLDFSGLDAAVQGLQPIANSIESIAPSTAAPEPAPTTENLQPPAEEAPAPQPGTHDDVAAEEAGTPMSAVVVEP